ncbi:hypothetical protein GCM10010505_46800 [Kitasatospora aburaviensis]
MEATVRAGLAERARRHGQPLLAIVMTTPLDVCLRRNSERPANRRVPDDVLRWQHQLAAEAWAPVGTQPQPTGRPYASASYLLKKDWTVGIVRNGPSSSAT